MDKLIVHGRHPLSGNIFISGSKNSSLPILAATLLTREKCTIRRVPDLSDTNYMTQILASLGAEVERASGTVIIQAENLTSAAPYDLVRKMRASICIMGPLLARTGTATISLPGGCIIGDRPIDLHLRGLQQLGAHITTNAGNIHLTLPPAPDTTQRTINMRGKHGPTVLGTGNHLMAATLTPGTTTIEGAAAEPEVTDLAHFLTKMGARIAGIGTRTLTITGVPELHGAEHTVIPDRIEAGTFLIAGAIAGTTITLKNAAPEHLTAVLATLEKCGFPITVKGTDITISPAAHPNGTQIPAIDILPPPVLRDKNGKVITPEGFKSAFLQMYEAGLKGVGVDPEYGGQGAPQALTILVEELLAGANPAFGMYGGLARGVAEVIHVFGTARQKALFLNPLYSGTWGGTMCLTEPHAGSDVGSARTSAKKIEGNRYKGEDGSAQPQHQPQGSGAGTLT